MAIVEFAPIRIPLRRRLQTTAVVLYYYSFYFGALLGSILILLLLFSSYYPLALLYLGWAYLLDYKTPSHGGRRSEFMRHLKIWTYFRDYFPIQLVKTKDLDPEKNYIFGYHPHGILCAGAFCSFATEATEFSKIFPGITPHLLPLMGKFFIIVVIIIIMTFMFTVDCSFLLLSLIQHENAYMAVGVVANGNGHDEVDFEINKKFMLR